MSYKCLFSLQYFIPLHESFLAPVHVSHFSFLWGLFLSHSHLILYNFLFFLGLGRKFHITISQVYYCKRLGKKSGPLSAAFECTRSLLLHCFHVFWDSRCSVLIPPLPVHSKQQSQHLLLKIWMVLNINAFNTLIEQTFFQDVFACHKMNKL